MIEPGTTAPDFTLPDQNDAPVTLSSSAGTARRPLLLSQGRHLRVHDAGLRHP